MFERIEGSHIKPATALNHEEIKYRVPIPMNIGIINLETSSNIISRTLSPEFRTSLVLYAY
jgi:hypothetical protein